MHLRIYIWYLLMIKKEKKMAALKIKFPEQQESLMSNQNLLILGYGMQGKAALYDCLQNGNFDNIVVADSVPDFPKSMGEDLNQRVTGVHLDATDFVQVRKLIQEADVVIEALPASLTVPIGKIAAEEGVHIVSSMYYQNPGVEDPQALSELKKELAYIEQTSKKIIVAF